MKNKYINTLLGDNEKMLYATRQHWFVLFGSILVEIIFIIILLVALTTASIFLSPFAAIGALILLIPLGSMVRDILIWFNRQYIVSNRRVIQVNGIINKNVIDSSLEKVNDVRLSQSFFGRIFNYGSVEILTASELGANLFQKIEDPVHFKTAMLNAKEKLGYHENGIQPRQVSQDIPDMIAKLDELRKQGIVTEEEFIQKKTTLLTKI